MSRDMPAGYDPKLADLEIPGDPTLNSIFSAPPEVPGAQSSSADLDAQLFGSDSGSSSRGVEGIPWAGSATSIFEAAIDIERKKQQEAAQRGDHIPAYMKQFLREADEEAEETEETEDAEGVGEDLDDIDFGDTSDVSDADFGGGIDDSGSDVDIDSEGTEFDEDLDIDIDEEDAAQTQMWKEEDDVEAEMSKLLGDDSPYTQGTSKGFDPSQSATYANASSTSPFVDDDLVDATNFKSGGFFEEFEDGFVFVSGEGHTLAFARPEAEDQYYSDSTRDNIQATLVFKPNSAVEDSDSEEGEIFIDLSGTEIDALASALRKFQSAGSSIGGIMEKARRRVRR